MVKYTLIIEYLSKGNNFSQVATLCGCSRTTVSANRRHRISLQHHRSDERRLRIDFDWQVRKGKKQIFR